MPKEDYSTALIGAGHHEHGAMDNPTNPQPLYQSEEVPSDSPQTIQPGSPFDPEFPSAESLADHMLPAPQIQISKEDGDSSNHIG